jgi:hypothetical protein
LSTGEEDFAFSWREPCTVDRRFLRHDIIHPHDLLGTERIDTRSLSMYTYASAYPYASPPLLYHFDLPAFWIPTTGIPYRPCHWILTNCILYRPRFWIHTNAFLEHLSGMRCVHESSPIGSKRLFVSYCIFALGFGV